MMVFVGIRKSSFTSEHLRDYSLQPSRDIPQQSSCCLSLGIICRMKMIRSFAAAAAVALLLAPGLAQTGSKAKTKSCWDTTMSQAALDECAGSDFHNADKELNRVYQALVQKIKGDSAATESLKSSEHAWLLFRDAQMKALHPHPDQEGSVSPMCASSEAAELTLQRVKMLKEMLNPQEGDVCAYSAPY
jgi:uncharacterized protein YecT (DUF1311 family)